MIHLYQDIVEITCLACLGTSLAEGGNWGKCPQCGHDLGDYTDADLQVKEEVVGITVDRLTGQVARIPA